MHTIIGVSLIAAGLILIGAANVLHFKAEAELLAIRPELADGLYWFVFRKHGLVAKHYKAEFPDGHRIQQSWMCAIGGMIAFLSGLAVLGFFQ